MKRKALLLLVLVLSLSAPLSAMSGSLFSISVGNASLVISSDHRVPPPAPPAVKRPQPPRPPKPVPPCCRKHHKKGHHCPQCHQAPPPARPVPGKPQPGHPGPRR